MAALATMAAGCGSTATTTGGASTSGVSAISQIRAYSHCMRSHDVADFPDPDSSGQIPKTEVVAVRQADPSLFSSAESACGHLLPPGGNGETPAEIAQDWTQDRKFAQCMRHHGVPNWPDATDRSATDRRPVFRITAVGLDGNSPPLRAKARQCASSLHMIGLPVAG